MNLREIETLVDLVHVARVSEVTVSAHGRRITIRKDPNAAPPKQAPVEVVRAAATPPPAAESAPKAPLPHEAAVTAPMVGIFHTAPTPVAVGGRVEAGQVVGAIESMRLMNEVTADVSGVVEAILVEDGMAVEYGQTIFKIDTAPVADDEQGE